MGSKCEIILMAAAAVAVEDDEAVTDQSATAAAGISGAAGMAPPMTIEPIAALIRRSVRFDLVIVSIV